MAPAGVLIYETFSRGNERVGRPRNPDFLLAPGELYEAVAPFLQVVAYEQGLEHQPRLCGAPADRCRQPRRAGPSRLKKNPPAARGTNPFATGGSVPSSLSAPVTASTRTGAECVPAAPSERIAAALRVSRSVPQDDG